MRRMIPAILVGLMLCTHADLDCLLFFPRRYGANHTPEFTSMACDIPSIDILSADNPPWAPTR